MHLSCGWIVNDPIRYATNASTAESDGKEFWKSVNICHIYGQEYSVLSSATRGKL